MATPVEGIDPARPDPGSVAAVEPQATPPAPAAPTDPDEIELQQAIAAVQTEEAAGKPAASDPADKAEPNSPLAPEETQAQQQRSKVVARQRFDALNERAQRDNERANKAEQAAAYYKGLADARSAPQQPAGQGQPQNPAPTPEQRLAQVHTFVDKLAKKFDAGEISMADFKREERRAQQYEHAVREAMLVAKVRPQQQPVAAPVEQDALYLETLTAQLEQQHQWVQVFEDAGNKADWEYLKAQAVANLVERGIDPRYGALGKFELRKEMAALADQYGPALVGPRAQAKGIPLPGQQPAGQQQKLLSPQAQARAAKLDMAANAPPNLASLSGSTGTPGYSLEQIAGLSEADFDKLPASVRNKALGLTT